MRKLCITYFLWGMHSLSFAQLLTNNNVQIMINPGVQLTVKGDVLNNPGTAIDNTGTIDLTGNWINNTGNTVFGTSAGTVIMNGTNQNIAGSNVTTFYNLDLYNGTKTLLADATTGGGGPVLLGRLNCNGAILDLNSHTLSVTNASPLGITRTTGYILSEDADNSSKVWWVSAAPGIHTIPFGNAAGEDVSFSFACTPPAGLSAGSLRASTYRTAPDNTPYPVTPVLVTHVNDLNGVDNSANIVDRFWHIEKIGTTDYYFTYAPSENAANGNTNMRAQQWNAPFYGWNPPLPGQTNPAAQQVFVPNIASSNPLTMTGATWAISLESNPLPVELLFFSAKAKNSEVECTWSTASEINNDYFIVMRSKDGLQFEEAGKVDGAGNSNSVLHYSFTDKNPYSGTSYYRLKQVDFDGVESYSQIAVVRLSDEGNGYSVYPNPVKDNLYIHFEAETENAFCMIKDVSGKIIKEEKLYDTQLHSISLNDLADGLYFLDIIDGEKRYTDKIQLIK